MTDPSSRRSSERQAAGLSGWSLLCTENLLDSRGQAQIILGQAAGAVRGQLDDHLIPRVRPVRVMIHFLRGQRHLAHEAEGLREIAKFKHPAQLSVLDTPTWQFRQLR